MALAPLLANPFAPEVAYNKSKNIWVLQPVYAVYYTVLHLLHHIKTGGAGVRMLLDTDLLLRKDPTLAPQVLELAERSGLERSFGCILALCKQWLDTPLHCSVPALDTDTVEKFAAVILGGGVFGHGNGNTGAVFLAPPKGRRWQQNALYPFGRIVSLLLPKSGLYGLPVPLFDPAALSASLCIPTPILSRSVSQSNPLRGGIASHCRQKSRCCSAAPGVGGAGFIMLLFV